MMIMKLVRRLIKCRTCGELVPEMKWFTIVVVMVAFAAPARADSRVQGWSVEITYVQGAADVSLVVTRFDGQFYVADVQRCGKPQIGPAYVQYVNLDSGDEYRTLYANSCRYDIFPY